MNVIALVPLGNRDRHHSGALTRFRGEPLLSHAVRGLLRSGCVDRVVVAGPPHNVAAYSAALALVNDAEVKVLAGGDDRIESMRSALTASSPEPTDLVLVHDASRPFTPAASFTAVVSELKAGAVAAVPVEPVTDTIKIVDSDDVIRGTRDRTLLRSIQAPQGFRAATLRGTNTGDPLTELGTKVRTVAGHPHGMRLVSAFDLAVIEALLAAEGTP
ncbi:2-C-methyl-D-erythritol 4-phosphate cytidylyltransferase [Saccharomonospora sp. NPDC006951]